MSKLINSVQVYRILSTVILLCTSVWGCMDETESQIQSTIETTQTEYTMTKNILALSAVTEESVLDFTLQNQLVQYASAQQPVLDLNTIDAIAIDFDKLDSTLLTTQYAYILDHLKNNGGTVLVQNAQNSEDMASLIGVGVAADFAYIKMPNNTTSGEIRIYDHPLSESTQVELVMENDQYIQNTISLEDDLNLMSQLLNEQAAVSILAELNTPYSTQRYALLEGNSGAYAEFYVNFASYGWDFYELRSHIFRDIYFNLLGVELPYTANLDVDFTIQLGRSERQNRGQYVIVKSHGVSSVNGLSNNNTGGPIGEASVGPFQDKVSIDVNVSGGGMTYRDHAPQTSNGSSSFETSTGFELGVDAGGLVSAGLNASLSNIINCNDFGIYSVVNGEQIHIEFQMQSTTGGPYDVNDPFKMVNWTWGGLHQVPRLSYGALTVASEHVYRSDLGAQGNITIDLSYTQRLIHMTSQGHFFHQDPSYESRSQTRWAQVSVNFARLASGFSDVVINEDTPSSR